MVMLMLFLMENDMRAVDFFEPCLVEQQGLDLVRSEDFFNLLKERGIRKKSTEHSNLRQLLQCDEANPDILNVDTIKRVLEQMAENEDFMEAIREDIMAAEQDGRPADE